MSVLDPFGRMAVRPWFAPFCAGILVGTWVAIMAPASAHDPAECPPCQVVAPISTEAQQAIDEARRAIEAAKAGK